MVYIFLLLSMISYSIGEYFSKKWALDPNIRYAVLVCLAYFSGTLSWLPAILIDKRLAIVGTLWTLVASATTVAIGVFLFHESLTPLQKVGLMFTALALVCLNS